MSDKNNPQDLDKYGAWVKNAPKDIKGEELPENALDDIDLPSDDDMFNDIDFPLTAEDLQEDKGSPELEVEGLGIEIPQEEPLADQDDGDTTLSADELLNITESQDAPAKQEEADGAFDDFNLDGLDITDDIPQKDAPPAEAPAGMEEPAAQEFAIEEPATEEISLDGMPDGEIDLDDFMSDSGGPSSAPDGDVDLSAFMDGGADGDIDLSAFMDDSGPSQKKEAKPEEIEDQKSLDIDVSFDDSAQEIVQEDTGEEAESPAPAAESAPADDMFSEFGGDAVMQAAESPASGSGGASADDTSEEIDLSDFGFDDDDSNIGMTNGPDSGAAPKKEVIDYDMKVSADDDSKTPSVQDVVMGNIESSEETEFEEGEAAGSVGAASEQAADDSLAINEKGKEILEQIMGELSSLKDEIKNLKSDFAELKDRPTPAAEPASIPAAKSLEAAGEDTGFFGADDGDDTIALSGNELTNILSSAEFSTEDAVEENEPLDEGLEEPVVEEAIEEPLVEESAVDIDESLLDGDATLETRDADLEEPTIDTAEITPEDLAGTTDEFGEENVLPEEISVPKIDDDIAVESSSSDLMDSVVNTDLGADSGESLNHAAIDDMLKDDISIEDSLDDDKIGYMEQDVQAEEDDVVSVDDIVKENISLQDETHDDVTIGVGSDIHSAFEEADAAESDIADSALAERDAYESSVSDIMKENISLQDETHDDVTIGVGSDIHSAFEEADAAESDIADSALAEKDAYESSKAGDDDFNLDDDENEEPVPETIDASILAEPAAEESADDGLDLSIFDEPAVDDGAEAAEESAVEAAVSFDEPSAEEPVLDEPLIEVEEPLAEETIIEETAVEEPAQEAPRAAQSVAEVPAAPVEQAAPAAPKASERTVISKDLKSEIVSVLSYMDQLLENLPEDKIAEFAKSEHFVTYKKLFDELGLS